MKKNYFFVPFFGVCVIIVLKGSDLTMSNRLQELRKEKGLSQKALADKLNIPFRTYQRWEAGGTTIKSDKSQQLADYFGVSVGYLLGYSEFDDHLDAYLALYNENNNNDLLYAESLVLSWISQDTFSKIKNEYNNQNAVTGQVLNYTALLRAIDNLRESDESKLLIWFASLDKNDKMALLNLAESLSSKTDHKPI